MGPESQARMDGDEASDLAAALRLLTRDAHAGLEDALHLMAEPLSRDRFVHVLSRFRGFHAAWEPAMRAREDVRTLFEGRERLAALDRDLVALGLTPEAARALPRCHAAADLGRSRECALGSLYVMEGSTLGGAVIARALAQAPWPPPQGLTYFDGHGARTGALWRGLKATLRDEPERAAPAVVAGALETFDLLRAWAAASPSRGAGSAR